MEGDLQHSSLAPLRDCKRRAETEGACCLFRVLSLPFPLLRFNAFLCKALPATTAAAVFSLNRFDVGLL